MKKDDKQAILAARVPKALVRQLDRAAKRSDRSRSAELRVRLEESFANTAQLPKVPA